MEWRGSAPLLGADRTVSEMVPKSAAVPPAGAISSRVRSWA
jgi:hypothetical protein